MSKRSLTWLRQHTNVEDLLDDGVENNSDAQSFASGMPAESDARGVLTSRSSSGERGPAKIELAPKAVPASYVGVLLGAVLVISDAFFFVDPQDLWVYHHRIKYLPSFVEHVTRPRSEFYGAAGFILGIVLLVYSTYKQKD